MQNNAKPCFFTVSGGRFETAEKVLRRDRAPPAHSHPRFGHIRFSCFFATTPAGDPALILGICAFSCFFATIGMVTDSVKMHYMPKPTPYKSESPLSTPEFYPVGNCFFIPMLSADSIDSGFLEIYGFNRYFSVVSNRPL